MKKICLKTLLTALLLLCASIATAHDFEVDGIFYNILSSTDRTVAVTYKGNSYREFSDEYSGVVTIPANVTYRGTTYSITMIEERAFYECIYLTSVTIGNSVRTIGEHAFYCIGAKEVHITDLAAWCNIDFYNSSSNPLYYAKNLYLNGELVTNLIVPEGVTNIKTHAFVCCNLVSVTIPNSVTTIEKQAFSACNIKVVYNNSSLDITAGSTNHGNIADNARVVIKHIDKDYDIQKNYIFHKGTESNTLAAYLGNDSIISLPANYNGEGYKLGDRAFYNCSSIESITIPNSVTSIGESTFYNCFYLTNLTIGNSVIEIGNYAFENCFDLTEVTIPNSVTSIGNYAFRYCTSITSLTIGNSVTSIGCGAFYYCKNITSVNIPNNVTSIREFAFYNCSYLENVTIGNSVTTIGNSAFQNCTTLKNVTIGNCVRTIANSAFSDCNSLTSITSLIPAENLFGLDSYTFYNVDKQTCTLYVPAGAKETYATTNGWKDFTNIVELEPETPEEEEPIFGDLNGDGIVNIGDITILVEVILGKE